jgi:putative heme-binding domain-containing protein
MNMKRLLHAVLLGTLTAAAAVDPSLVTKIEALRRLKDTPSAASPAVQQVVASLLPKLKGEPEFVGLVRDFKIEGQDAELLEFAAAHPDAPAAADAMRWLLDRPQAAPLIEGALKAAPERAAAVLQALGATTDNRAVKHAAPLVNSETPQLVRRAAAKAMTRLNEGAQALLAMTKDNKLPEDLKLLVGTELRGARWADVRQAAATLFPPPKSKSPEGIPPIAKLVRMPADAARGAAVFRRTDVACINCHQVNGEGVDFGPKLSEIGAKLGKDALAEAILDPSAGIAFGYELWNLTLKGGDELSGLIASETETELALKAQGGAVTKYAKADIAKREKQTFSAMPTGLQENMTVQDFADLLEYLSTLKKASN